MPASQEIFASSAELAELAPNATAENGAELMIAGSKQLIAAAEAAEAGEEGSVMLNNAAAEVMVGAEEFVQGMAESGPSIA